MTPKGLKITPSDLKRRRKKRQKSTKRKIRQWKKEEKITTFKKKKTDIPLHFYFVYSFLWREKKTLEQGEIFTP